MKITKAMAERWLELAYKNGDLDLKDLAFEAQPDIVIPEEALPRVVLTRNKEFVKFLIEKGCLTLIYEACESAVEIEEKAILELLVEELRKEEDIQSIMDIFFKVVEANWSLAVMMFLEKGIVGDINYKDAAVVLHCNSLGILNLLVENGLKPWYFFKSEAADGIIEKDQKMIARLMDDGYKIPDFYLEGLAKDNQEDIGWVELFGQRVDLSFKNGVLLKAAVNNGNDELFFELIKWGVSIDTVCGEEWRKKLTPEMRKAVKEVKRKRR